MVEYGDMALSTDKDNEVKCDWLVNGFEVQSTNKVI